MCADYHRSGQPAKSFTLEPSCFPKYRQHDSYEEINCVLSTGLFADNEENELGKSFELAVDVPEQQSQNTRSSDS